MVLTFDDGWGMCMKTGKVKAYSKVECEACSEFKVCKPCFGDSPLSVAERYYDVRDGRRRVRTG